jgi:hypothetical protein
MISAINGPSVAGTTVSQDCTEAVRKLSIEIPTHSLSVKPHHPLGTGYGGVELACSSDSGLKSRTKAVKRIWAFVRISSCTIGSLFSRMTAKQRMTDHILSNWRSSMV